MVETISAVRLSLLQLVAKHPDVSREKLLTIKGITDADLDYLLKNDMMREREVGKFRVSHFGELVIKRGV